ncbi:hypothetical protein BS47DRAFT_1350455 [Hydnum rufescens UP504]|uniref:Uncharacterized protein n=1 Tax=Hydnum rufescens UP504 TaxID=1448309 RepID=A0A9P6AM65_9AGAM|nr:hypothetical protein BS47DRAFT_1350455 [Hydnum rufescens UP504]
MFMHRGFRGERMSHKEWANVSKVIQIKSTITFPTTTSNSQPRTAADCIKVKAYPMKQQRELGRNSPSPPSDLKVERITGDVETAKARNS